MVIHVVCHKYTDAAEADKIAPMLKSLEGKIEGLLSLYVGRDFLQSGRSYHLGLVAKLADREALARYAEDPEHVRIKVYIHSVMVDSVSADFEV